MNLADYHRNNTGKGIVKFPHYFNIYERYFGKFVGKECNILEIGLGEGGSIQMWADYFGPKSMIYGIDHNDRKHCDNSQIKTFVYDQGNVDDLKKFVSETPEFDVIIDDGGHAPYQQIPSFEYLFPRLREGGVYMCEDITANYSEKLGGGYGNKGSAIEYWKDFIDYIHGYFNYDRGDHVKTISKHVYNVAFYYNVIVIEKHNRDLTHCSPIRTGSWRNKIIYSATGEKVDWDERIAQYERGELDKEVSDEVIRLRNEELK